MIKIKFIQASLNKCKRMRSKVLTNTEVCHESCCQCCFWPSFTTSTNLPQEAEKFIPKDVPKGHMVVYVGQNHKRHVIKISLLKQPLFQALLDQTRDQYDDSTTPHRLCLPCDETVFLHVLRCSR